MINTKPIQLVRKAGGDCEELPVPKELQKVQVLTEEQVRELASYAKAIEKHYGCYMDMEWGVDERNGKIWLLQARPETVWSKKNKDGKGAVQGDAMETTTERVIVVKDCLPARDALQVKRMSSWIRPASASLRTAKFSSRP